MPLNALDRTEAGGIALRTSMSFPLKLEIILKRRVKIDEVWRARSLSVRTSVFTCSSVLRNVNVPS